MTDKTTDIIESSLTAEQAPAVTKKRQPKSVAMPDEMIVRVRTKRGIGHIIRVREDRKRPFLVRLETGGDEFWAIMDNVKPIGFAQSIAFRD